VAGGHAGAIACIFAWSFAALGLATRWPRRGHRTLGSWPGGAPPDGLDLGFSAHVRVAGPGRPMALTLSFGLLATLAARRQRPLALLRNE